MTQRKPSSLKVQKPLHRDVGRYCLSGVRILAGMGAFDNLSRVCDVSFEQRPLQPYHLELVLSNRLAIT